jgi:hypothetical protein
MLLANDVLARFLLYIIQVIYTTQTIQYDGKAMSSNVSRLLVL